MPAIKHKDIVQPGNPFDVVIKGAKDAELAIASLKKVANGTSLNKINEGKKKVTDTSNKLVNAVNELLRLNKAQAKADAQSIPAIQNKTRELKKLQQANRDAVKINKSMGTSLASVKTGYFAVAAAIGFLIRTFGKVVKVATDFEKAMDRVQAITNATNKETEALTKNSLFLGRTTSKTATEVANLSTEFAKLGFTVPEILAATNATIQLSIAAGSDLADSAVVAASTIRQFGLNATETQRVVDVMAKSFASSALDMEKFKVAMAIAGPVAKNAGVSIERTTAILAKVSDAGVDASTAGTSLRNIFLELSNKGLTWDQAMQKIQSSTDKNKTALDLFGKKGATVATIIADTSTQIDVLTASFENSAGAAKRMADIMEDNLIGDVTKLQSGWEGMILSFQNSDGVVRKVIQGFTDIINSISDTVAANQVLREEFGEGVFGGPMSAKQHALFGQFWLDLDNINRKAIELAQTTNNVEPLKKQRLAYGELIDEIERKTEKTEEDEFFLKLYERAIDELNDAIVLQKDNTKNLTNEQKAFNEELEGADGTIGLINQLNEKIKIANEQMAGATTIEGIRAAQKAVDGYKASLERLLEPLNNLAGEELTGGIITDETTTDDLVKSLTNSIIEGNEKLSNWADEQAKKSEEAQAALIEKRIDTLDKMKNSSESVFNSIANFHEAAMNRELAAVGDNEERQAAIRKKYKEKEQQAALSQNRINTALAITKTFASQGFNPASILEAALMGAEGASQGALIRSQKFKEGTEFVQLDGNKPGIDTVPAWLTEGEGVMTESTNKERLKLGVQMDDVPEYIKKGLLYENIGKGDNYAQSVLYNIMVDRLIKEQKGTTIAIKVLTDVIKDDNLKPLADGSYMIKVGKNSYRHVTKK